MGFSGMLFLIADILIGIALIIYYIKHFKVVNQYYKYGLGTAGLVLIINLVLGNVAVKPIPLIMSLIGYVKITLYTGIGMHLCKELNLIDIPIIRHFFQKEKFDIDNKAYLLTILGGIAGSVIYSHLLFRLTSPVISDTLKMIIDNAENVETGQYYQFFQMLLSNVSISITEELVFRLVIFSYLTKVLSSKRGGLVISAIMWTLAHHSMLDPNWIKFAQIFPIGLFLGVVFKKYGLECCILIHAGLNIIMALTGSSLNIV